MHTCYLSAEFVSLQPRLAKMPPESSYETVATASWRWLSGIFDNSFDTLLAPNTLCTAANLAAPWSEPKYGAKMQPAMHFLLRNLQAPHGDTTTVSCPSAATARLKAAPLRLVPEVP
ncbi:hypothetical protein Lalb_Chr02g0157341 [Lupinus albus]|uniref:Uncharacterized protein n=1 Tax=Lupinus albus TaxID=3870 RepID=A0A6A4R2K6_LUPAL|nr:hypothetical protein Lalb_Chr02g0157341 [Lupinus albus]